MIQHKSVMLKSWPAAMLVGLLLLAQVGGCPVVDGVLNQLTGALRQNEDNGGDSGNGQSGQTTVTPVPQTTNRIPTANAGADQVVTGGATVNLGGSGSDGDGDALSLRWNQSSGTAVVLANATTGNASFVAPGAAATLVFTLTVSDQKGGAATDQMTVTVTTPTTTQASTQTGIVSVRSGGGGTCGGVDANVLVTSSSSSTPVPAPIAGGNSAPQCQCGSPDFGGDPSMLPLTTSSSSDSWGEFTTTFGLPNSFSAPAMSLRVRVDDGAQVSLNGRLIGTVDQVQGTSTVTATDASLFLKGTNTLQFYVVNTQDGYFGSPTGRGGPGDCMYVEFDGAITYVPVMVAGPISIRSGAGGACEGVDANVLVASSSSPTPVPAPIAGGNIAQQCQCGSADFGGDPGMLPLTTPSSSDSWGEFTTPFELPGEFASASISLKVRADDGAQVFLNDHLIATVDQVSGTVNVGTSDASLFLPGTNVLRLYVVNTQNGHFGSPSGRGGDGDCMYVEFDGSVTFALPQDSPPPGLIAWWQMDQHSGSTVSDASGNGHDLAINGAPAFNGETVVFNNDGTLTTNDADDLDLLADWSISYWVREDGHNPANPTNGWVEKVRAYHDAEGGWASVTDNIGIWTSLYAPNVSCVAAPPLSLGTWCRLTTTYDQQSNTVRIFRNATLDMECSGITMRSNSYPLILGGNMEEDMSLRPYCIGALADVRLYDRALSANEIASLAQTPPSP